MTTGFQVSAAILATAVVIGLTLVPRKMRATRAEQETDQAVEPPDADPATEAAAA